MYKSMQGRIVSLSRFPERKKPAVFEEYLHLQTDLGIVGDFHGDGDRNQVSIQTCELKEWSRVQSVQGHCFKRFKENILIQGISLKECRAGDLLVCGDVILEITDCVKRCYPDICEFASTGTYCKVPDEVRYACVKQGGILKTGTAIEIMRQEEQ